MAELLQPATESTTSSRHALRKEKSKRASALGNIDLEESDTGRPVQEQLRDILSKNAVRIIDLFREWDEDGNGKITRNHLR